MLKLGIIGLSEGNGHPYSWSAIINGDYNAKVMADCGYPVIPQYLAANRDTLGIDDARVTHVWTQDSCISRNIAAAGKIEHVAERIEDLIGQVDAVILARDDAENHVKMAKPFLDADVPIFIDKPLVITNDDLDFFSAQDSAGKFFMSCSSFRYAAENAAVKKEKAALGKLELATVVGKKDWFKYGVHMLEALFALLDDPQPVSVKHISKSHKDIVYIEFQTGLVATVHLFYEIAPTFQISLYGQTGWRHIEYLNWYAMFRSNLVEFISSVRQGKPRLGFEKTKNIIRTLIAARESLDGAGKTIALK